MTDRSRERLANGISWVGLGFVFCCLLVMALGVVGMFADAYLQLFG